MAYPDVSDPDLQRILASKLEFRNFYNPEGLFPHQEFIRRYMAPWTPYKGILLFHSMGSGKSLGCIPVAIDHYRYDKKRCAVITKGDSGAENFSREVNKYMTMANLDPDLRKDIFLYYRYTSLANRVAKMEDVDITDEFSHRVFILDEAHILRDMSSDSLYDNLLRIFKLATNIKIILATGTPMTDNISQIIPLVSVLVPDQVRYMYINNTKVPTMDPETFRKSLNGIISYNSMIVQKPRKNFKGDRFVGRIPTIISDMIGHQLQWYKHEAEKGVNDIYRNLSQISLFVFPDGDHGRSITLNKMYRFKSKVTITSHGGQPKKITHQRYLVREEYLDCLKGDLLRRSSAKYHRLLEILKSNKRYPAFIFVEEVRGSGLLLLGHILEQHGYEFYMGQDLDSIGKGTRYTFCIGSTELSANNEDRLHGFNSEKNRNGEYVSILLGSRVISESITLKNVRQFHGLTPHWNDSVLEQAIGRVVRSGSHDDVPHEERMVDIYIHAAVNQTDWETCSLVQEDSQGDIPKTLPEETVLDANIGVDILKLNLCHKKYQRIAVIEEMLKDVAVDRYIFRDENIGSQMTDLEPDVSTFVVYYLDKYLDLLVEHIQDIFGYKQLFLKLDELTSKIPVHPMVMMEAIFRLIVTNSQKIRHGYCLRLTRDTIYLTDDFTHPYQGLRGPPDWLPFTPKVQDQNQVGYKDMSQLPELGRVDVLSQIRSIDKISDKVSWLESAIVQGREDLIAPLELLWCNVDKIGFCHIMFYRDEEVAYRASKLSPKILEGKTRILSDKVWKNIDDKSLEVEIMKIFEKKYSKINTEIEDHPLYGFISVLDNQMRIKVRYLRKGSESDRRMDRRGRSLSSLRKVELSMLYILLLQSDCKSPDLVDVITRYDTCIDGEKVWNTILMQNYKHIRIYLEVLEQNQNVINIFVTLMQKYKAKDVIQMIDRMLIYSNRFIIL